MSADNILEIKHLHKSFGDFVLGDINLSLKKGYITGIIGPNGAGKSTTIKLIMNLIQRDRGEITVFDMDNRKEEQQIKERIGFVYDEGFFYEDLTVQQTGRVFGPHYRQWNWDMFHQYIHDFGLPQSRKVKDLSKGMKMKLSLAMALSHSPDLLIMDEPSAGLDPVSRQELLEILAEFIQNENRAVLLSTHITSDLDKIADYVVFIHNGSIVLDTAKDDIALHYGVVKGATELLNDDVRSNLIGIKFNSFGFHALTNNRHAVQKQLADRVVIDRATIEDVMLHFVEALQ